MGRQAAGVPDKTAGSAKPARRARRPARVIWKPLPDMTGMPAERQIAILKKDREALLAALTAAEARVEALTARQAEVADRVAWALDTLRDLIGDRR
jgi:hypothetical protein